MTDGNFIWADLSTFRPAVTQPFYTALFGWRYDDYAALFLLVLVLEGAVHGV